MRLFNKNQQTNNNQVGETHLVGSAQEGLLDEIVALMQYKNYLILKIIIDSSCKKYIEIGF